MQRAIISIFTLFAVAKAAPVPVFQHHHGLRAPQESSSFTPIITLTLIPSTVTPTTEAESEISTVTILTTMTLVPTSTPETSESVSVTPSSIASTTSASTSETIASSSVPASQSQSSESATSASATTSSAITTATSIPSSSGNKLVVAHMMVGNTYPFTKDTWKSDIKLAQSAGIDGFALNIGRDEWQPGHVADAYAAAKDLGSNFKLFLSYDMAVLPCGGPNDAALLRKYVTDFADHPNQLKVDGKVFASTFAGESCTFGQGSVAEGWATQFTSHPEMTGNKAIHFVPSFFIDPKTFNTFGGVMDGAFNFNSGWPIELTATTAQPVLQNAGISLDLGITNVAQAITNPLAKFIGATKTDDEYRSGLAGVGGGKRADGKKTYMAAVSPWFFTHYGQDSFNKNFIYLADSHLYPTRWEKLVEQRDQVDIVEIVTWNDYGESHYLKDPTEFDAQPNSQAWVDGFTHAGWLDMTAYYAQAFKTGAFPTITEDKLYLWSRPHSKKADAADPIGKPKNFELVEDAVWAVVFATEDAEVVISTAQDGSGGSKFPVKKGVNKLSVPITAGGSMKATLVRDGKTVVEVDPKFTFEGAPKTINFNAHVAFAKSGSA